MLVATVGPGVVSFASSASLEAAVIGAGEEFRVKGSCVSVGKARDRSTGENGTGFWG